MNDTIIDRALEAEALKAQRKTDEKFIEALEFMREHVSDERPESIGRDFRRGVDIASQSLKGNLVDVDRKRTMLEIAPPVYDMLYRLREEDIDAEYSLMRLGDSIEQITR